MAERIEVENVNHPGKTQKVDAAKYLAMKAAMLKALPSKSPGLTLAQLKEALVLPEDTFPGGEKAGWWMMCVQLDLLAKGVIARAPGSPVRLHKA